jgi:hypothetical protein
MRKWSVKQACLGASALIMTCVSNSVAQAPPTATEAFNLRIKCKQMADEKAEGMAWQPMTVAGGASLGMKPADVAALNRQHDENTEVLLEAHSSHYDAKTNRCYIEIIDNRKVGRRKENEVDIRQVYDAQTDDLLSFAKTENGKKVGLVFDTDHVSTITGNLGWDDANAYMDEKMRDKRD